MPFSNQSVKPAIRGKPHIKLLQGYWRVSPQLRPYAQTKDSWQAAYAFVQPMNATRRVINQIDYHKRQIRKLERSL